MRNFISKTIERLRGLLSGGDRDTPVETALADPITVLEEQAPGLRKFAKTQQLAFSTEAEQLEALKRLKQHWESLADPTVALVADDIKAVQKRSTEAAPPDSYEERPRGRKPSKTALSKAKRTKTRNAAARAKVAKRVSKTKRK
ncbi:hypothetical protein [Bradyrhizobium diazoefficiens]|uniref:hypothetical protein n=1 Tax=Bradyrhizobium diazoefficiens TaxID=1355477 RepID=UPI00272D95F6|nr:hypothetical protein [Bradyrhizobium diazoefficiens]WLA63777.1 hypothetical protein QNN01_36265 [Bradyrhizobium diazoefficiens]